MGIAARLLEVIGERSVQSWALEKGLSPQTVHEWIKHDRNLRGASMKALVAATGIQEEWWRHGTEAKPMKNSRGSLGVEEDRAPYGPSVAPSPERKFMAGGWVVPVRERARAELLGTLDFYIAWHSDLDLRAAIKRFVGDYNDGVICRVIGIDQVTYGWLHDLYVAWRTDDWLGTGALNVIGVEASPEYRDVSLSTKSAGEYSSERARLMVEAIKRKKNPT